MGERHRSLIEKALRLQNTDGEVSYVWPITVPSSRLAYRIAAAREYLDNQDIHPGPGDATVGVAELLRWVRSMELTGVWRQHSDTEDEWDPSCWCEEPEWWCPDGDLEPAKAGWSFVGCRHPEDLTPQWEDDDDD